MMKKLIALGIILLCFGCTKKIESDITSFTYTLGYGLGGSCTYIVEAKDEKAIYKINCYGMNTTEEEKEVDASYLKELQKIIDENEIYKWDGFDKSDDGVMDGSGFSLNVSYANGKSIKAHGYMKYPSNYQAGHKALLDFLTK